MAYLFPLGTKYGFARSKLEAVSATIPGAIFVRTVVFPTGKEYYACAGAIRQSFPSARKMYTQNKGPCFRRRPSQDNLISRTCADKAATRWRVTVVFRWRMNRQCTPSSPPWRGACPGGYIQPAGLRGVRGTSLAPIQPTKGAVIAVRVIPIRGAYRNHLHQTDCRLLRIEIQWRKRTLFVACVTLSLNNVTVPIPIHDNANLLKVKTMLI